MMPHEQKVQLEQKANEQNADNWCRRLVWNCILSTMEVINARERDLHYLQISWDEWDFENKFYFTLQEIQLSGDVQVLLDNKRIVF